MANRTPNGEASGLPTPRNAFMEKVVQEAERWIAEGRTPIRLDARAKSPPTSRGKKKLTHDDNKLSRENIRERLATEDFNLGVMLGQESGGLIDFDLDWPEARIVGAEVFADLPSFGRAGAKGSHRLAICPGAKSKKLQLPAGVKDPRLPSEHAQCVLELRANGLTMVPSSIHPSGEEVQWEKRCDAPTIAYPEALKKAGLVATLSVCLRLWPAQGSRDDTAMALAGALLSAGYDPDTVDEWTCWVAERAGDEEWQKRGKAVATAAKMEAGEAVTGLPKLVELLGLPEACVATFRDWLGIKGGPPRGHHGGSQNTVDPNRPRDLARIVLKERFSSQGEPALVFFKDEFHVYRNGHYKAAEFVAIHKAIYDQLETLEVMHPKFGPQPLAVPQRLVSNVVDALKTLCHLEKDAADPPCWIKGEGQPPWEVLVLRNGLFHLPTGELHAHSPRFFTLSKIDINYDADAGTPTRWLKFLDEIWPGDPEAIATLQEMMGYFLVPDTSQQKAFMFIGPPRSGKGTVANVSEMLLGSVNFAGIKLKALGDQFGLQSLIPKLLAVVSDARLGARTDRGNVVETVLTITGRDTVTVDRKNTSPWEGKLKVRFFIHTNELPRIEDMSGAFASRFVLLTTEQSFVGKEDPDLAEKLKPELPGILLWAIEGWRRLKERGKFVQPESSAAMMRHFERMSSPVRAFVEDRCVLDPEASVSKASLYEAFKYWGQAEGRSYTLDHSAFGIKLRAAFPGMISDGRPSVEGERVYVYKGLRLRAPEDDKVTPEDKARAEEEAKILAKARDEMPM